MSKTELSVVVPCYNEAGNIPHVLKRFADVFKRGKLTAKAELILVDNNSKDDTQKVLKKELKKYSFARSVFQKTPGYGAAVSKGLQSGKGTYLCWTHADMQTDPYDVVRAYKILLKQKEPEFCYIKGDRKGRPIADQFFTSGMSFFETLYLGTVLHDINAQPNIFHKNFLQDLWMPDDFSLDLYMLYVAKRRGLHLIRFPVKFGERLHGESSWNTSWSNKWKFIKRTFAFSFKLEKELSRIGYAPPSFFKKYYGLLREIA